MKILEEGKWKEKWSFIFSCKDCESKLEAEVGDVKCGEFGSMGDYSTEYYVECPVCARIAFPPADKLSSLVKKEANKKKN